MLHQPQIKQTHEAAVGFFLSQFSINPKADKLTVPYLGFPSN
jgi:hypothetical protein